MEQSGDEKEETSGLSESEESEVEDELEPSGIAPNAQDQVQIQSNRINENNFTQILFFFRFQI